MHGKGIFMYPNNNRYDGEFVENKKEGYGVLQYANGERYEGQWKENFANGQGSLTYVDGKTKVACMSLSYR